MYVLTLINWHGSGDSIHYIEPFWVLGWGRPNGAEQNLNNQIFIHSFIVFRIADLEYVIHSDDVARFT